MEAVIPAPNVCEGTMRQIVRSEWKKKKTLIYELPVPEK
jgi:hypothetical protein